MFKKAIISGSPIKRTLPFPIAYFVLSVYLYQAEFANGQGARFILLSLIVCFVAWFFGILIGLFFAIIFQKPSKEPLFYLSGQITLLAIVVFFIGRDAYNDWQHRKNYGNIDHNYSVLNLGSNGEQITDSNPLYIKTAFNALENKFANRNDIILSTFHSEIQDGKLNDSVVKVHVVYFEYSTSSKTNLLAKVLVLDEISSVEFYNEDASNNKDYQVSKANHLKQLEETNKEVNRQLEEVRKRLRK